MSKIALGKFIIHIMSKAYKQKYYSNQPKQILGILRNLHIHTNKYQ